MIYHALFYNTRYTDTAEDTVKVGLRGGCDLDCGGFYQANGMVCDRLIA